MVKKEGYIIHYLLQHSTEALTTLGQIPALVLGMYVGTPQPSHCKTVTATDQERPPSGRTPPPMQRGTALTLPLANCQTEELDRWFTSRFTEPYYSNPLPLPQPHRTSAQQAYYSTAPGPSNYQLNHWLLALWRLFQNTAWDRWQYQNGITISPGKAISPPLETVPL